MTIRSAILVMGCACAMACGSTEEEAPAAAAPMDPAAAPAVAPAAAPVAAPAAAGAPIALAGPGFMATPVAGTAGGPTPGETMSADCIGNFPLSAQHTVTVGAAIPMLRVLVNAGPDNDTTLAVRRPDGTYACNDDSGDPANGLNPLVEILNAAPGEYQIYVGGYALGDTWASYNLTFNETAGVFPSTAAPNP